MKTFVWAAWLILLNCGLLQAASLDHSVWDALLKKHVTLVQQGESSLLDYAGMAADRATLTQYLEATSAVSNATFEAWSKPEQMAFLINAYNAWTVELVLTAYPKLESIKDLGSLLKSPWKKKFFQLLGESRSLDDLEHGMLRAEGVYEEPRVHFALNCASGGCPALRPEAFVPERLEAQLEEATINFLKNRQQNRLEGDTLHLSSIFAWYRGDFERGWGGFQSLEQFLAKYAEPLGLRNSDRVRLETGQMAIQFTDYDWKLNKTR